MQFLPEWLQDIVLPTQAPGMAASLFLLFVVMGTGILMGKIKISGISIGMAGIMFTGILAGHWGYQPNGLIMDFLKDLGLILFVYAIGMQVGPSFFSLFRMNGLVYNAIAIGTVLSGGIVTILLLYTSGLEADNMVGIMSGAVTNTPGLGAAKEALKAVSSIHPESNFNDPANAYAIVYPFGVLGLISIMVLSKAFLKINVQAEIEDFEKSIQTRHPAPLVVKCRITNPAFIGKRIEDFMELTDNKVVVSRIKHSASAIAESPLQKTVLKDRDVLMLVGFPHDIEKAVAMLGRVSQDKFIESDTYTTSKIFVVSNPSAVQKTIEQLNLEDQLGVHATRIYRAGLEILAQPNLVLHLGDRVKVVGNEKALEKTAAILGNSINKLQEPQLLSIFLGVILGILAGSTPIMLPNLSAPVKLGMAAGPLIVAILISRYGGIGKAYSYLSPGAVLFMKDFGICLFFAVVGIQAGENFADNFIKYNGWVWLAFGIIITVVPMVTMVIIATKFLKINFIPLLGIMAGTYTDPAALSFSKSYFKTDLPTQAYATVYPIATILRILLAQLLILYFAK